MRAKVVLGMSGGVDSSVAAALLKQRGYQVIGVNLMMLPEKCDVMRLDACCGSQAVDDARAVCDQLDVPFYCVKRQEIFESAVIDYFCAEYRVGRTPNPCVVCNHKIKFPQLLCLADQLGADYIASGHFANVRRVNGGYQLCKGVDEKKDQSYYLFGLDQSVLSRTIFPLGKMLKRQVRNLAVEMELKVHTKPESQEICFVPGNSYSRFLKSWVPDELIKGNIVDKHGRVFGRHSGIQCFTIGQRRRTGVACGRPVYVIDIDRRANAVVVGEKVDLMKDRMLVADMIWCGEKPNKKMQASVKIRYNHCGSMAAVYPKQDNCVEIKFEKPERAITPGQAAVLYQDDVVLGGGWIEHVG